MRNVQVHRYQPHPDPLPEGVSNITDFWQGWIEPDDLSWIVFVDAEGRVVLLDHRDSETGAVLD